MNKKNVLILASVAILAIAAIFITMVICGQAEFVKSILETICFSAIIIVLIKALVKWD